MNDKKQLGDETVIVRSESLISNNLGDDVVMMDIEQGSYYGLEVVAARIWELTEKPVSIASICKILTAEYDVSKQKCQEEVTKFLNDLLERDIVQTTGE